MGQQCGPGAQAGVQTSGVHLGDYLIRHSGAQLAQKLLQNL